MERNDSNYEKLNRLVRLKRDALDEARLAKLYGDGITFGEAQRLVKELEVAKGFGSDIRQKIIWLVEEFGEFAHAYKHNDKPKMIEELIDMEFFILSILNIVGANSDVVFLRKLEKNWKRTPVNKNGEFHFDRR
jgi:NTP pyrophosphatase (non-canonical NTP hydrolase)